jgi:hypothetical protein
MRRLLTASILAGFALFASSASAMNLVNNLDDQPHTFAVQSIGGATRTVTLQPKETFRFNEYRCQVYLVGQEDRIQPSRMGDQFVIWDDGTLRLQRRQYQRFKH